MKKVTTINLNGKAFSLEEEAYTRLKTYLEKAEVRLSSDPDKTEIVADLEQAVADKCAQYVHAGKDVVTETEMKKILADMGVVEPDDGAASTVDDAHQPDVPKRLYRLTEGQTIAGVCNGLAAYFNLDVTIMRLLFVFIALITSGMGILFYIILAIVIPEAKTPEEKAELRGRKFNAAEVISTAKKRAVDMEPTLSRAGNVLERIMRITALVVAVALLVVIVFLSVIAGSALLSVVFDTFNFVDQLAVIPDWAAILGVVSLYFLIVAPLGALAQSLHMYAYQKTVTKSNVSTTVGVVVLWVAAAALLLALGFAYLPQIYDYIYLHDTVNMPVQVYDSF